MTIGADSGSLSLSAIAANPDALAATGTPDFRIFVTTNSSGQQGRNPLSPELVSRLTKICVQALTGLELLAMAWHMFTYVSVQAHLDLREN